MFNILNGKVRPTYRRLHILCSDSNIIFKTNVDLHILHNQRSRYCSIAFLLLHNYLGNYLYLKEIFKQTVAIYNLFYRHFSKWIAFHCILTFNTLNSTVSPACTNKTLIFNRCNWCSCCVLTPVKVRRQIFYLLERWQKPFKKLFKTNFCKFILECFYYLFRGVLGTGCDLIKIFVLNSSGERSAKAFNSYCASPLFLEL